MKFFAQRQNFHFPYDINENFASSFFTKKTLHVRRYGYRLGGRVSPGFEAVEREFRRAFALGRRRRAQLCVYVGEEAAVDLWGESEEARAEEEGGKEYDGDSMQVRRSPTQRNREKRNRNCEHFFKKLLFLRKC